MQFSGQCLENGSTVLAVDSMLRERRLQKEGPAKKSKWIEEKCTTGPAEVRSPQPAEPSQDSSDSTELPDVPWVHT